jgi:excisionase family DNA binding protein
MNFLSIDEVANRLSVSVRSVRRLIASGEFIEPVRVTPRRIRFCEDELSAWAARRARGMLPHPPQLATNNKTGAAALTGATNNNQG